MVHHQHKHPAHKHKRNKLEAIDYIVRFFMIATPLAEVPQAYNIYHLHSAREVSIITWTFFAISSVVWLIYAVKHNVLPLAVASSLYLVVESTVVVGVIIYR